ncbi:maleylpyruvate isomerase N-terminal domain-containing protein [Nocardioides flavescens]|nr:maleylpyruvate isomerase N-terminal domain-containing protein [Nocardioides flavescens]
MREMVPFRPAGTGHRSPVQLATTYAEVVAALTTTVEGLAPADFERPTRTEWTVRELLWHQTLDAIRALATFATVVDRPVDTDAVTYWTDFHPDAGDGGAGHAAYVRAAAAAFDSADGVAAFWRDTGPAAARAAAAADPAAHVATQGHVLTVGDFVSTLIVEATVHLLDLSVDLEGAAAPPAAALAETRRVLEALEDRPTGGTLPSEWDDTEAVLRATGRLPGWPVLLG